MSGIFQKLPTQLKKPLGRGGERSLGVSVNLTQIYVGSKHAYLSFRFPRYVRGA